MKARSSDDPEFRRAIQFARRSYLSYSQDQDIKAVNKEKIFRQVGGGRKTVAIEVSKRKILP